MRTFLVAVSALFAFAAPAAAQQGDPFAGTWAFQTENYSTSGDSVSALSGAVIIRRTTGNSYDIRMFATELHVSPGSPGEFSPAHQRCTGEARGQELTIVCEVIEAGGSYQPDNFVLQLTRAGQMDGMLVSASNGQARFTRVR